MSETNRPSLAILTSGHGATAEALIRATQNHFQPVRLEADVCLVISDQPEAGVFKRIDRLNRELGLEIQTAHISGRTHPAGEGDPNTQTLAESEAIAKHLDAENITVALVAGYLKRIRGPLREEYAFDSQRHNSAFMGRLALSHLGPLDLTKGLFGLQAQTEVLKNGYNYSDQSLLSLDQTYKDVNGEGVLEIRDNIIITQHRVPVLPADSPKSLLRRARQAEAQYLPEDLNTYLQFHMGYADRNPSNSS